METKYCLECKYFLDDDPFPFCLRDNALEREEIDLVRGTVSRYQIKYFAYLEREENSKEIRTNAGTTRVTCGTEGKFWEKKEMGA